MSLPTIQPYTNSDNAVQFFDGQGNTYWFSYRTLIAFKSVDGPKVVRQNEWSTTTGKHLNAIDGGDKKSRLNRVEFEHSFAQTFGQ